LFQRRYRFFHDLFTTLVDCQWRWTLLAFFLSFIFTWLFYAVVYWLSAWAHGDLELLHLPNMQGEE
jgi:Inward rectifier potassium channel transmembrane domain